MTSDAASITPPLNASTSPDPPMPSTIAPAFQCDAPLTITAPLPPRLVPSPPMLLAPLLSCPPLSTDINPSAPPRPTFNTPLLFQLEPPFTTTCPTPPALAPTVAVGLTTAPPASIVSVPKCPTPTRIVPLLVQLEPAPLTVRLPGALKPISSGPLLPDAPASIVTSPLPLLPIRTLPLLVQVVPLPLRSMLPVLPVPSPTMTDASKSCACPFNETFPTPPPPTVRPDVRFHVEFVPDNTTAPLPAAPLTASPPTTADVPFTTAPPLTCSNPLPLSPTLTNPLLIQFVPD